MTHEPQDTNSAMVANQENTHNLIDINETDIVNEGIYADHTNVAPVDDID